jgi:hypothetical protein
MIEHEQLFQFDNIKTWSLAKTGDEAKNEDQIRTSTNVIALADGATDKTGFTYPNGRTGGRHLAEIAADTAISSAASSLALGKLVTRAIRQLYQRDNPAALNDPGVRADTTLVSAVIYDDQLQVTQIGDSNFRLTFNDGTTEHYSNDKRIDNENAALRSEAIKRELALFAQANNRDPSSEERATIIAGGRGVILERLKKQYELHNSSSDPVYGYGTLDGSPLPEYFDDGTSTNYVKTYRFDASNIQSIEVVSDGFYGAFPEDSTIAAYQNLHREIHSQDPDKFLRYLSTKPTDDASVVIASLTSISHRQ